MRTPILLLGLGLVLGAGCSDFEDIFGDGGSQADDDDGGDGGSADDMLTRESFSDTSNNQGLVQIDVDLDGDQSAFLITVESSKYPVLEEVKDPDGNTVLYWEDWLYGNESLTYAFFWAGKSMAFNWPIRPEDGPLQSGTWTVIVSTIDNSGYYSGGTDVDVTIDKKADPSFSAGEVRARIVWADGVGDDADVVAGVEAAVERWREVWGQYGLELVESYHDSDLDPDLSFYANGSSDVEANAERFDGKEVIVVIGDTIDGDTYTYGVSGGIPGSIEPNRYSFVVISWLAHAGNNGTFSDNELQLMGETMAHEVGHYTGLFHPVESDYAYYDALDDTPTCNNWQTCENQMGDNLMFPYPLCYGNSCDPQDVLTDDQQGVGHRYTGAL